MPYPTLAARELCEERADLVTWLEDDSLLGGQSAWATGLSPTEKHLGRREAKEWALSLRAASLTYTTTDLTRTALAAGDAFDDYRLDITDVPTQHGFISWAEPITAPVETTMVTGLAITAASWAVQGGGVKIRWWGDKNSWVEEFAKGSEARRARQLSPKEVTAIHRMHPTRTVAIGDSIMLFKEQENWPSTSFAIPGGSSEATRAEYVMAARRIMEAERTLLASWLLMGQTLTVSTEVHTPKAVVKRVGRLDPSLLGVVRQVALRHKNIAPERHGEIDGPKREWSYRWVVSGHWRKKRKDAKPDAPSKIWISDYFKGPDGAPLLDPSKLVHVLRR